MINGDVNRMTSTEWYHSDYDVNKVSSSLNQDLSLYLKVTR